MNTPKRTRFLSPFAKVALLISAIVLPLLVTETVLRIRRNQGRGGGPIPVDASDLFVKSDDPELIYELAPGAQASERSIVYKINADGFADDPFPEDISAHDLRIVVVGDSVAMGLTVHQGKAFPQLLEPMLNEHETLGALRPVVFNMAVSGYSTAQEIRMIETRVFDYEPHLIILAYVMNDPDTFDGGLARYFTAPRIEIVRAIQAAVTRSTVLAENLSKSMKAEEDYFRFVHRKYRRQTEEQFERLGEISRARGVPIMVLFFPHFEYEPGEPYAWADIRDTIAELTERNDLEFFDLTEVLQAYPPEEVSNDWLHPSDKGHRLVAEALLARLAEGRP